MKRLLILFLTIAGLASCLDDKGNYDYLDDTQFNKVTIEGLEDTYNVLDKIDHIQIEPQITGTVFGDDDKNYEYQWHIHDGGEGGLEHNHIVISKEKNLDYLVNLGVGNYSLYLTVLDKSTGIKTLASSSIKVITGINRGFLILGDNLATGEMGLDMVAMPSGRDTVMIENVFDNSEKHLKGADRILYQGRRYNWTQSLWMCCDDGSFRMNNIEDISIVSELNEYGMIETEFAHKTPMKVMDVFPHPAAYSNNRAGMYRGYLTEDMAFFNMVVSGEYFSTPCNRLKASDETLFGIYPMAFCLGVYTSAQNCCILYNTDADKFMKIDTPFGATYCMGLTDYANDIFYWDQKKYDSARKLVWGGNSCSGSYGSSFAIVKDTEGKYYLYKFQCATSSYSPPLKQGCYEVDPAVAEHFDDATHYCAMGTGSLLLYAYGSTLYLYDYQYKTLLKRDMGAEITYLDYEFCSAGSRTSFIVATYSDSQKGIVRKMDVGTDPNVLEILDREKEVWKTNLRVKDVEYKYAY